MKMKIPTISGTVRDSLSRIAGIPTISHRTYPCHSHMTSPSSTYLSIPLITIRNITLQTLDKSKGSRTRIVILGSGWAGFTLARGLDTSLYQPVIISPRPYFIFTPLLASTAVGTLESRCVMENVRTSKGNYGGFVGKLKRKLWSDEEKLRVEYFRGICEDMDFKKQVVGVRLDGMSFELGYDKLVIAVGCYPQTFNIPGVREYAFFLKGVTDAERIRRRILELFEWVTSNPSITDEEKKRLLHFAIVGGGPTGIEFAAELYDLVKDDLCRIYDREMVMRFVSITIFDVAKRILSMFDESVAEYARKHFRRQGIDVKTESHVVKVTGCDDEIDIIGQKDETVGKKKSKMKYLLIHTMESEKPIPAGLLVWSTGLSMNPLVTSLTSKEFTYDTKSYMLERDPKAGRIVVSPTLNVSIIPTSSPHSTPTQLSNVYALGDCAYLRLKDHDDLPATAQVASQQAKYLVKMFNCDKKLLSSGQQGFEFTPRGVMAYIGGWSAIVEKQGGGGNGSNGIGRKKWDLYLRGRVAWVLWRMAYLSMAVSWRNKVLIPVFWVVNWVWGRDVNNNRD